MNGRQLIRTENEINATIDKLGNGTRCQSDVLESHIHLRKTGDTLEITDTGGSRVTCLPLSSKPALSTSSWYA